MLTQKIDVLNLFAPNRVLIVHSGSLFDDGMMCIVGINKELDVMKVDYTDEETLARNITTLCPAVVLIRQTQAVKPELLIRFLDTYRDLEKTRLVIFHQDENLVDIYCRKAMRTIHSRDFLAIIQGHHTDL